MILCKVIFLSIFIWILSQMSNTLCEFAKEHLQVTICYDIVPETVCGEVGERVRGQAGGVPQRGVQRQHAAQEHRRELRRA